MTQKSQTQVAKKNLHSEALSKEQLIKRLLAKAKLDASCCGRGGRCHGSK